MTQPIFLAREQVLRPDSLTLPWLVLADNLVKWIPFKIKTIRRHEPGFYSHAMTCHAPGQFASQDFPLYRQVPAAKYLSGCHRVKIFWFPQMTTEERADLRFWIAETLEEPIWRRLYDLPGILGHWIGRRDFNAPHLRYCTERAVEFLDRALPGNDAPRRPTPGELDNWLKRRALESQGVAILGLYSPEFAVGATEMTEAFSVG